MATRVAVVAHVCTVFGDAMWQCHMGAPAGVHDINLLHSLMVPKSCHFFTSLTILACTFKGEI